MVDLIAVVLYLGVAVPLAVAVAASLGRSARTVLADVYDGDQDLADAVSRLLVVAFSLLDVGFVTVWARGLGGLDSGADLPAALGLRLGVVMLVLGAVHLTDLLIVTARRQHSRALAARAAAAAQRWSAGPPLGAGYPPPASFSPTGRPAAPPVSPPVTAPGNAR